MKTSRYFTGGKEVRKKRAYQAKKTTRAEIWSKKDMPCLKSCDVVSMVQSEEK